MKIGSLFDGSGGFPLAASLCGGVPVWASDRWGDIDPKEDFTDEEYRFWLDVRNTHAAVNGKTVKDYAKKQMLTWYNKLATDSAEYKMWGNGIALPCALYVMQGIQDALEATV
jgi:DNA (cytosine-5)-methyltransferase 1